MQHHPTIPEHCDVVNQWHRLRPHVREAIMTLVTAELQLKEQSSDSESTKSKENDGDRCGRRSC